jgi:L-amino acid N-acyltransferase YncA
VITTYFSLGEIMIKVFRPKELNEDYFRKMHNILIENQYITYPDYVDHPEWFYIWIDNMKKEDYFYIIVLEENNEIKGFLNYGFIDGDNWISEIQVNNKYKNTGITKNLLKKYVELNESSVDDIVAHINPKNNLSKEVFLNHVGFKPILNKNNRYHIKMKDLIDYLNKE